MLTIACGGSSSGTSQGAPAVRPTPVPKPKLNLIIYTCDTGTDIWNGLGEVTNGYVVVQNVGNADATNIRVVLGANDKDSDDHPDTSYIVQSLPPEYQISLKLTVDTANGVDTALSAKATSDEGISASASKSSCKRRTVDTDALKDLGVLFKIVQVMYSLR